MLKWPRLTKIGSLRCYLPLSCLTPFIKISIDFFLDTLLIKHCKLIKSEDNQITFPKSADATFPYQLCKNLHHLIPFTDIDDQKILKSD